MMIFRRDVLASGTIPALAARTLAPTLAQGQPLPACTDLLTGDAAWGGRLIMTAGGGDQGSVPDLSDIVNMTPAAIGGGSDSGHELRTVYKHENEGWLQVYGRYNPAACIVSSNGGHP
jgi:hypothetical protein